MELLIILIAVAIPLVWVAGFWSGKKQVLQDGN